MTQEKDFIKCIFRPDKVCPETCACHSVAKSLYETRQPGWMDTVETFGDPKLEEIVRGVAERHRNQPLKLGNIVRFFGLDIHDCKNYVEEQLKKIDPNRH